MNNTIFDFLLGTYFPGLFILLVTFLFGQFFFGKTIKEKFELTESHSLFISTVLALFLIVTIVALYLTKFKTIFIIPASLIVYIVFHYKCWKPSSWSFNKRIFSPIIYFIIAYTLSYILLFWVSFSIEFFPYFSLGRDDMFYSQVAFHIKQFGVENPSLAYANEAHRVGIVPYHYFEGYLTSLVNLLSNSLMVHTLHFSTFPIFISVLSMGIINCKTLKPNLNSIIYLIIAVLFLFFAFYYNFKNFPFFTMLVFSMVLYVSSYKKEAAFWLLLVPAVSYGQLPLLLFANVVLICFFLFKRNREYFRFFSACILILFTYLFYKKIQVGDISLFTSALSISQLFEYYLADMFRIKTSVHIGVMVFIETMTRNVLQIVSGVLIFLFVLYFKFKLELRENKYYNLVKVYFIYVLFTVIVSSILSFIADANQILIDNLFLLNILVFLMFGKISSYIKDAVYFKIGILLLFSIWSYSNLVKSNPFTNKLWFELEQYSESYLMFFNDNPSPFISAGARYINPNVGGYGLNSDVDRPGWILPFLRNGLIIHTINKLEVPEKQSLHDFFNFNKRIILPGNYVYQDFNSVSKVIWEQKSEEEKINYYIDFIKRKKLNYLFVNQAYPLPNRLKEIYKQSYHDSKSGETVYYNLIP